MTDFSKKLEEAASQIHQNVQQEKDAEEAERQMNRDSAIAREEAISKSHGVAVRFSEKHIAPLMSQIREQLPSETLMSNTMKD